MTKLKSEPEVDKDEIDCDIDDIDSTKIYS